MKNFKDRVKQDFIDKTGVDFTYDKQRLNLNVTQQHFKRGHRALFTIGITVLITIVCIIVFPLGVFILTSIHTKSSFKKYSIDYNQSELKLLENTSFRKLNDVTYPNSAYEFKSVDENYKSAVKEFSNKVYGEMEKGKSNQIFSPYGLYMNLDLISLVVEDENLINKFDTLLGLSSSDRLKNFSNAYVTDYYCNDNGTLQMYNAVFSNIDYNLKDAVIHNLTKRYAEAYAVDFMSNEGVSKILEWIDSRVMDTNFISKDDLELTEDTILLFLSTSYFKNKWRTGFSKKDNYLGKFYGKEKESEVTYMNHTTTGIVYEYDKYVSAIDYYTNNSKIKYIVPKSTNDDIFSLTNEINIFVENEKNRLESDIIALDVPKFEVTSSFNFTNDIKNLGLEELYNSEGNSLSGAFKETLGGSYIKYTKQKNRISFDEDGTTVESLTFSSSAKATMPGVDTYFVTLNQPFIYIIYDENDLPLYVGWVNQL